MGDFVYNGDHAITFQIFEEKDGESSLKSQYNTWTTWHMAPKSRPYVESPKVKEAYVDVPAADGSLDYTDVLTGKAVYANRTGSWEFIIDNGYSEWYELYSDILLKLHGKKIDRIILDDDPKYFWRGRLSVKGNFSPKDYNMVTIEYNLEPYKIDIDIDEVRWWKWRELFSNNIVFGPFTVNGVKARNIYNETGEEVEANINVTYAMTAFPYDGTETTQYRMFGSSFEHNKDNYEHYDLKTGDNKMTLLPGDNFFFFVGAGNVMVEYDRGKIL